MPGKLPIAVDHILQAVAHAKCRGCRGLGRWRTKVRCPTCNGKGTTAEIVEICTVCEGRGQLLNAARVTVDCDLCDGYGAFYRECWECRQAGFIHEGDDYCGTCNGAGETSLAGKVAVDGDVRYVRHLLARLREYTERGSEQDLEKACGLDGLLIDIIKRACEIKPPRDRELFPQADRIAYGNMRVVLHRAVEEQEKRAARERIEQRAEFVEAARQLRSQTREIRSDLRQRFWEGLGHW